MVTTTNFVHGLTLLAIITVSMFTVTMANKDWPSFGKFNYTDWWSRFGNHNHQINKTEQQPKKIIVGGSQNWHFGYNYSDWAIKNGPFYLNDTLVFKYDAPNATSFPHSVYMFPTWWSFMKCDVKRAKMIANHTQGVGEGFKFVLNKGKPTLLRILVDITLSGLKDQLNQINSDLHYRDTRSVDNIEYRRPLTGSDGSIEFTQMKLKNDDDVRTMFSIFDKYNTKGLIELDVLLIRSFEDIRKSLIRPRTYEEIRELMDGPEYVISLADP